MVYQLTKETEMTAAWSGCVLSRKTAWPCYMYHTASSDSICLAKKRRLVLGLWRWKTVAVGTTGTVIFRFIFIRNCRSRMIGLRILLLFCWIWLANLNITPFRIIIRSSRFLFPFWYTFLAYFLMWGNWMYLMIMLFRVTSSWFFDSFIQTLRPDGPRMVRIVRIVRVVCISTRVVCIAVRFVRIPVQDGM